MKILLLTYYLLGTVHHALYVFLLFLPFFFLSFFLRSGPPASSAPCVRISSLSLSIFPFRSLHLADRFVLPFDRLSSYRSLDENFH